MNGKLYHSLPEHFNDPFECKPHFNLPDNSSRIRDIHEHLVNVAVEHGKSRNEAEMLITEKMKFPEYLEEIITKSMQNTFSEIRISSFTTSKENLLLWSHYADSHKGFCVEYDSTVFPISYAFKVQYKNEYPMAIYPAPPNALGFKPALVKSKAWEYEEEYRLIFVPEATLQPENDGTSLILRGDIMKNVYFGANMDVKNKQTLIDMIERGPFNPGILDTSLSKSSYELVFSKRRENNA